MRSCRVTRFLLVAAIFVGISCDHGRSILPTAPGPVYIVSGTVRSDDGRPLAGAAVAVAGVPYKYGPAIGPLTCCEGFSTHTDAAGQYRGKIAPGSWRFGALQPGFKQVMMSEFPVYADTIFDVTLTPGVDVYGFVADRDGHRLGDALVEVVSGPDTGHLSVTWPGSGNYLLGELHPGTFRIRASKPDYGSIERTITAFVTTSDFNFVLQ
jgi:hypothetical protein